MERLAARIPDPPELLTAAAREWWADPDHVEWYLIAVEQLARGDRRPWCQLERSLEDADVLDVDLGMVVPYFDLHQLNRLEHALLEGAREYN